MNLTDPAVREAGARALYVHTSYSTARTLAERERWWDERVEPEDKTGWLTCWDRIVAELAPVLAQQADAGWMGGGSVARDVIARLNEGPDVGGFDIDRQADAAGEA